MKDNEQKFSLPLLPEPRTVRICFHKTGRLQFISHLDLQRTFARVLVRAGLPIWYSKGFNPHIKMVFALPLPVGVESECELLDIRVEREMSDAEILRRLNEELTDELRAVAAYPAERKFSEIAFAEYDCEIRSPLIHADAESAVRSLLEGETLPAMKKTKSGEKEINLLDAVLRSAVRAEEGALYLSLTLMSGEGGTVSPELVLRTLAARAGILTGDPMRESYRALRRRLLLSDGVTEFH